ncbi:UPF0223 family protein [Virgibacillus sp. C22-A2]|uniref:UPF0223 protein QGM71_04880 n=1 Tax=Virgibacillus tibetensis TaxID=3042313 RepID=A0ABU6KBX9_9BACI|nr:UPF0223 family protein [Virgibacillus sp. C22-A2]
MEYNYPMDETWTKDEIIDVVNFFALIERAYEEKVKRDELLSMYRLFKQIVPSKAEEKTMFADFQDNSGYSAYHVIKKAKESQEAVISMK